MKKKNRYRNGTPFFRNRTPSPSEPQPVVPTKWNEASQYVAKIPSQSDELNESLRRLTPDQLVLKEATDRYALGQGTEIVEKMIRAIRNGTSVGEAVGEAVGQALSVGIAAGIAFGWELANTKTNQGGCG